MQENSWLNFVHSGKVEDYLKYKQEEKAKADEQYNQSVSNTGADNRGE